MASRTRVPGSPELVRYAADKHLEIARRYLMKTAADLDRLEESEVHRDVLMLVSGIDDVREKVGNG